MIFNLLASNEKLVDLYNLCKQAEDFVYTYPDASARAGRNALEFIVKLFYTVKYGKYNSSSDLFGLLDDYRFKSYVDEPLLSSVHTVRQIGNNASHAGVVSVKEAMLSLRCLYDSVFEILKFLKIINTYPEFDEKNIAQNVSNTTSESKTNKKIVVKIKKEDFKEYKNKIDNAIKMKSSIDFTEAETRNILINLALKDAGWKISDQENVIIPNTACIEIKINSLPVSSDFPNGIGYADYVLFGADNKPLAVIEAKRTCLDIETGAKQAKIYAEGLKKIYGVMPVIFYTNGYQLFMVDGIYPARRIFGYYTKDELHSLITRRGLGTIDDTRVNQKISDRYFIQLGCTKICETFSKHKRMALNVMATGTGKTRFAIALVDILQRCNWVNRVLFLADRTELVDQAKRSFVQFLPNTTLCAISEQGHDKDYDAQVILSTYPTLLNLIDNDENRKFSIGHFDLIILDECHRSIYNKYQAILNYFDALVLGLTATPREQVDASTYELFKLENGEPTFNYDYETAVNEGFLVDYTAIDKTTNLLKQGIQYKNLSEKDKKEYDEKFIDEQEADDSEKVKKASEFYRNIINKKTVDLMLKELMEEGLKINKGERLGKSIIFAVDHQHAEVIVRRFKELYPEKGDDYCQLVDNYVNKSKTIIDDFKQPNKEPIITVSVDMLDTGIDVPEVLNLVFFKRVRSSIKFWQMIGRGTRICKDLNVMSPSKESFGHDKDNDSIIELKSFKDKQGFYIFDFCDNFEFFDMNPKGNINTIGLSISQKIFELKLDILFELQKQEHQECEEHLNYYNQLKSELVNLIKNLNRNKINVKYYLKEVDKYSDVKNWDYITIINLKEIKKIITQLIESDGDDASAKSFDSWLFNIELAFLEGDKDYSKPVQKVTTIIDCLLNMQTIPEIKSKAERLRLFLSKEFWETVSISKLETIRNEVRDLIKYLNNDTTEIIETNFEDEIIGKDGTHITPQFKNYKQRVIDYLAETIDCDAINKIKNLEPLTKTDIDVLENILCKELGSKEDYEALSKGTSLAVFVRKIVGLNNDAVASLFNDYLGDYNFNSAQQEFLHQIVTFVLQNGDIELNNLINDDPFRYQDYIELFDDNIESVYELVNKLHDVIAA